jgi:WD40 repeat protein
VRSAELFLYMWDFCYLKNFINVLNSVIPCFRDSTLQSGLTRFDVHTVAQFEEHYSTVWRVCWNITGTILASSGDDGFVRLWKGKC